uniref:RBR-type E3 ubiquitin transferase n=1 Tax=Oryza rufipogon TaxID=4529 RepID=A0A0E0NYG1_ORYRU
MSSDDEECFYDYDEEEEEEEEEEPGWDDGGGGDTMLVEEEAALPERPVDCWAITEESLPAAQQQDLSMVMNLLYIKQHQARALLIHHRWKMESILDHFDRKGRDRMLRETGVVIQQQAEEKNGGGMAMAASPSPPPRPRSSVTCYVCFEDVSSDAVSTMDCGHCFCNDCWTEHFFACVNGGQKQIRCMAVGCAAVCDEDVAQRLLGGRYPGAARRLRGALLASYVEDNAAARWCPSAPHCGRAVRVDGGGGRWCCEVSCPCGASFCFGCAAPAHSPCPCAMWERWEAKCRGESMNVDWILANTKSCPNWLCGAATGLAHNWTSIDGHSCNRYDDAAEKRKVDGARRKVLRYAHYYERYKAHGDSRRAEAEKLGPAIEARARRLREDPDPATAPASGDAAEALAAAHRALLASRDVLSRSYAFAYHMFGGEERTLKAAAPESEVATAQALFEDHQEMAERHVEKLSGLLAADAPPAPATAGDAALRRAKQDAVALTAVVEKHCGEMHKCIQDELLPMLVEPISDDAAAMDGSDDECCYYYDAVDSDGDEEEEEEIIMLDEDDVGLLDGAALPPPEEEVEHRAICWAITKESLAAAQEQDLSMVMNLVNVERHNARALLAHHRWKMERIYDRLDMMGRDALLRDAGVVVLPEKSSSSGSSMAMAKTNPPGSVAVTCNVCFEEYPLGSVSAMDCGHCFCNDCWTEYFAAAVSDGSKQMRCMEVKCTVICDEAVVRRLLHGKHPGAAARLDRRLLEAYVEASDAVRWCPSAPHCGRAIRVDGGGGGEERYAEVSCPCGAIFFFRCGGGAHSPCPCPMWDKWGAMRGGGEVDNLKWIVANTKSCPKCSKPIEKNGGCNHVTCTCGQHLCYACGAATGTLYMHICNRYKEEGGGGGVKVEMTAGGRQRLRFMHYYERFEIHTESYKEEQGKLGPAIDALARRLEADATLPWSGTRDARWPSAAHRRLLRCRQVLPRSYVLAYYMFGGGAATRRQREEAAAQNRFEDLQGQLEHHVEVLSRTLAAAARPADAAEVVKAKRDADNLARVVEGLCAGMYRCVQDELLPLLVEPMNIAAYHPDGPAMAKEFPPATSVTGGAPPATRH